ncbi:alpha/beta fold hydrolase [uncultured Alsobacter sp.]|uniref:alpha/beta fold hydrolase n=1 Tax=uncultured Alsobacter sp. TaxID=1748258 RepID=UPI0025FFB00D|nr:alpha/beta fold hydrolase [uncultured Alsobacter sp.]
MTTLVPGTARPVSAAAPGPAEPLVLLPGTLCDERVWQPVVCRLLHRPVIVKPLVGESSTAAMARRLLAELPARFSLAGFSLGGIVALEMIAQAPERIARLALVDTNARPDPPANHTARRNAVERAAQLGMERYVSDKLWSVYVSGDHVADEAKRSLVAAMSAAAGLDTFRSQSELAISRADSRPRLGAIRVPTLVLCGAEDKLCTPAVHEEMAAGIPGARLVQVPRTGHFALIEDPDAVAAALRDWLDLDIPSHSDVRVKRTAS